MPKDTKTLGNSKARACESLGFVHKKGCARVLTQPLKLYQIIKIHHDGQEHRMTEHSLYHLELYSYYI